MNKNKTSPSIVPYQMRTCIKRVRGAGEEMAGLCKVGENLLVAVRALTEEGSAPSLCTRRAALHCYSSLLETKVAGLLLHVAIDGAVLAAVMGQGATTYRQSVLGLLS